MTSSSSNSEYDDSTSSTGTDENIEQNEEEKFNEISNALSSKQYTVRELLGKGSFGVVYKVSKGATSFAAKVIILIVFAFYSRHRS